jgi:predicted transcriptional regulator of viral defense system
MEFKHLLALVGNEPVFETSLLLAGKVNPGVMRIQLSRWTKSGKIIQLRRGLYTLAPPYQKVRPHPFGIANQMQPASYVSGQSALAFYGLIPETKQTTLSVTSGRPERLVTPLGVFEFRHIKPGLLHGCRMVDLNGQQALVAVPEKALLDLIYLQPAGDTPEYLRELRLQNLYQLQPEMLRAFGGLFGTPKLIRAVEVILRLALNEGQEFEAL